MPQLDAVTFFGQVSWLIVVFLGYYLVIRGDIFPALTRLVKVRAKKKTHALSMSQSYTAEAKTVMQGYDAAVAKAALGALTLIQAELDNQSSWAKAATETVMTSSDLGSAGLGYLEEIAEIEGEAVMAIDDLDDISLDDAEVEDTDA
jgi:hypothetical protein